MKICSMGTTTIAIDDEGAVRMWGTGGSAGGSANVHNHANSTYGYGLHDHRTNSHPQLVTSFPFGAVVVDVSCGLGHALFVLKTGRVLSSGSGGNGRLGLGDTLDRKEPSFITSLGGDVIAAVQCGASHSLALSASGRVYTWGKNTQGQCGTGHLGEVLMPLLNRALVLERIVQLAAGWEHSIALTEDGAVYAWGCGYKDNRRGIVPPVLGLGDTEGRTVPEKVRISNEDDLTDLNLNSEMRTGIFGVEAEPYRIVSIACGWDHCLALDNRGRVRSWGSGQNGKLGKGDEDSVSVPSFVTALDGVCVVSISAGCEHSAAVSDEGLMYSWGHGDGKWIFYQTCNSAFSFYFISYKRY